MQCTEDCSVDTPDAHDQLATQDDSDAKVTYPPGGHGDSSRVQQAVEKADDTDFTYSMNHARRGMAIIINNRDFEPRTGMGRRGGTDTDAANLYQRFRVMRFEVQLKNNLKATDMFDCLQKAARANHENADCFVCVILSHGEEGKVYGTDGVIDIDLLTENFKGDRCKSLAGKPKLFFIQACRGNQLDHGVEVSDAVEDKGDDMEENTVYRIPSEADFLMAYSVVPGYFSWRNSSKGSWFIQALCQVLEKHGEDEIMTIMTRVNKKVAIDFESNAAKEFMTRKKQIPCIVSMLTKQLYFTKKK